MTQSAKDLWLHEGGSLITPLVKLLAKHDAVSLDLEEDDELGRTTEMAFQLSSPVVDYQGAARAAGFEYDEENTEWRKTDDNAPDGYRYHNTAATVCHMEGLEPEEIDVVEHWAVSEWLAERLADGGEKVVTGFAGFSVWAKTTEGPAFEHPVIVEIAETYNLEAPPTPAPL